MGSLASWVKNPEELRGVGYVDLTLKGLGLSQEALSKVLSGGMQPVPYLRMVAVRIATIRGFTTIDDVREFARIHGVSNVSKGAWGSVFKLQGWEVVGYQASTVPSNHGRKVAVWERKKGR